MPGPRLDLGASQYLGPDAYPHWLLTATETPACRGANTELFFADRKGAELTAARALCAACPLLDTCRDWALDQPTRYLFGVWGGMTQHERQVYHRRLRAAQQAQEAA